MKAAVNYEPGPPSVLRYEDVVLDPRGGDVTAAILELATDGADIVVDPVGGALGRAALEALAFRGRFVIVGSASREESEPLDRGAVMVKNASITGMFLGGAWRAGPPSDGS